MLELLAVGRLMGDGFDHAARNAQIGKVACGKCFQLGQCCPVGFAFCGVVSKLRAKGGEAHGQGSASKECFCVCGHITTQYYLECSGLCRAVVTRMYDYAAAAQ